MSEESRHVLSFLTPEQVSSLGGLPPEGVVGLLADEAADERGFRANQAFIDFMHDVIRRAGPQDPGLGAAAAAQGEGWVYVLDLRTPDGPQGRVPPEDIIGGFQVVDGHIVHGSYMANKNHRVFTRNGIVRLSPSLQQALVQELTRRQADARRGRPTSG